MAEISFKACGVELRSFLCASQTESLKLSDAIDRLIKETGCDHNHELALQTKLAITDLAEKVGFANYSPDFFYGQKDERDKKEKAEYEESRKCHSMLLSLFGAYAVEKAAFEDNPEDRTSRKGYEKMTVSYNPKNGYLSFGFYRFITTWVLQPPAK